MTQETHTEIWKDIHGYKGKYQASTLGNIRSSTRKVNSRYGKHRTAFGKVLRQHKPNGRYCTCSIGITKTVHRLIALTFIPNPDRKPFVNHIDGDKHNNSVPNLEWSTQSENEIHAIALGLRKPFRGKHNPLVVLKESDIPKIREACRERKYGDLKRQAKKYGVSSTTILDVVQGRSWAYIPLSA